MSNTRIFARLAPDGRQFLAYEMQFRALGELAMVLPLPVVDRPAPDSLQFLDLSLYPEFFQDLGEAFAGSAALSDSFGPVSRGRLEVVEVGSFEASYVPSLEDFSRLDPRFRMPEDVWARLPGYRDYAFAVFKLKPGQSKVHPMAFSFRTAMDRNLFFPTVHVHDGHVPDSELFDHSLYLQGDPDLVPPGWKRAYLGLETFVQVSRTQGLLVHDVGGGHLRLDGRFPNADIIVPVGAGLAGQPPPPPLPPQPEQPQPKPGLRAGLVRKRA